MIFDAREDYYLDMPSPSLRRFMPAAAAQRPALGRLGSTSYATTGTASQFGRTRGDGPSFGFGWLKSHPENGRRNKNPARKAAIQVAPLMCFR